MNVDTKPKVLLKFGTVFVDMRSIATEIATLPIHGFICTCTVKNGVPQLHPFDWEILMGCYPSTSRVLVGVR